MPGVPSGRACETCRKQKKKCDLTKPSCARCSRLRIPCVGAGQQRFKFMKQSFPWQGSGIASSNQTSQAVLPTAPINTASIITSTFINMLNVKDTRFDLSIYGNFIDQIPKRLGSNKALDAAAVAIITAMPYIYTHKCSANMYSSYARALKSTRVSLSNPAEARAPETLCAIYLLMVCQGWIGRWDDAIPKHGEALSHLLSKGIVQNWQAPFEKDLVNTLALVTVLESFSNPDIELDPRILALSEAAYPAEDRSRIDSLHVRNLAKISKLLQHPDEDLAETQSMYRQLRSDRIKMLALLLTASRLSPSDSARNIQVRVQSGYALLLALALLFNTVLQNFESASDLGLVEESALFVDDAVSNAKQAAQHRPLGSSSIPLCLVVAWAVSDRDKLRSAAVEGILAEYQLDFDVANWLESAQLLRAQLRNPLAESIVSKPHGVLGFSGIQMGLFNVV